MLVEPSDKRAIAFVDATESLPLRENGVWLHLSKL